MGQICPIPDYDRNADEAKRPVFRLAPVGEHVMEVTNCDGKRSGNNRPMVVFSWLVTEGEHDGAGITARFLLDTEWGPVQLIRTLDALGVPHSPKGFDMSKPIGKKAVVRVKMGKDRDGNPQPDFHYAFASPETKAPAREPGDDSGSDDALPF